MGINLGSLINAGTQAAGNYENAQAEAGQRQIGAILQSIAMQRQFAKDALAQKLGESTIANNNAKISLAQARGNALANPKPKLTPHSFMLDGNPVMGFADQNGNLFDADHNPVSGKVTPFEPTKPDPTAVHAANRAYDAAHPLPVPPSFTPFQGTDPTTGAPIVRPFNTKSGQFGDAAPIAPKAATGAGAKAGQQSALSGDIEQAIPIMTQLAGQVNPTKIGIAVEHPMAGNLLLNEPEQQYLTAARTFLAGVLHLESGARLSKEQWSIGAQRYLPMPGDAPSVVQQKLNAARETARQRTSSPAAVTPAAAAGATAAKPAKAAKPGADYGIFGKPPADDEDDDT